MYSTAHTHSSFAFATCGRLSIQTQKQRIEKKGGGGAEVFYNNGDNNKQKRQKDKNSAGV
jgi:hypothetical protein